MKFKHLIFCLALSFMSCNDNANKTTMEMEDDTSIDSMFEKNSETVMANLKAWQNEKMDYSMYADDFVMLETGFGAEKDSLTLSEMKEDDKRTLAAIDFELLTDPVVLLPGVNPDTKKPDGSVRYYGNWKLTRVATDSTPEKSGVLKVYSSYDFNEDGKILYQQLYADFGGIVKHLMSNDKMMETK